MISTNLVLHVLDLRMPELHQLERSSLDSHMQGLCCCALSRSAMMRGIDASATMRVHTDSANDTAAHCAAMGAVVINAAGNDPSGHSVANMCWIVLEKYRIQLRCRASTLIALRWVL